MKKLLLTFALLFFCNSAFAAETVKISVNGMVCDFCARSIEKVFGKQEAVDTVTVDLTSKLITAKLKDGKTLSDEEIKKLITDAGYNTVTIERKEQ